MPIKTHYLPRNKCKNDLTIYGENYFVKDMKMRHKSMLRYADDQENSKLRQYLVNIQKNIPLEQNRESRNRLTN